MELTLGYNYYRDQREGMHLPVRLKTKFLINGHMLIVGSSGVGKSYTLRRLIKDATSQNKSIRFHVFDVHGDLEIDGASTVMFSEQAPYGLNPLVINPDEHFGGVRKCIQSFIRTINQASATSLGLKQEAVLRNLLYDVYNEFGFSQDDPSSWGVDHTKPRIVSSGKDNRLYLEVPISEKDEAKALGARWDPHKKLWWIGVSDYQGAITKWKPAMDKRRYPTLADVVGHAKRLHVEKFLGSDQRAIRELGDVNKKAKVLQKKTIDYVKTRQSNVVYDPEDEKALDKAREAAVSAYMDYVYAIKTGEELDNILKYDSADVLKSVCDRLENLVATGIYKDRLPPFDPDKQVWRYKLNALFKEEKKMMVLFLLQDIFNHAVQRGEQSDIVDVVILDELATYTSTQDETGDGIIGVISREARKFGLALWAANQTPNVPESLISSVATKIILGLDEMYWNQAVSKLRVETKLLAFIQPTQTIAVQMKERGSLKNRWWWVTLADPNKRA